MDPVRTFTDFLRGLRDPLRDSMAELPSIPLKDLQCEPLGKDSSGFQWTSSTNRNQLYGYPGDAKRFRKKCVVSPEGARCMEVAFESA